MLLAARLGDYDLLCHQIDVMQTLLKEYGERLERAPDDYSLQFAALEDDCIFSILMYALERKEEKVDVDVSPFIIRSQAAQKQERSPITQAATRSSIIRPLGYYVLHPNTVRLFRWDTRVTHFDIGIPTPFGYGIERSDLFDQITVYLFEESWYSGGGIYVPIQGDKEMQLVFDTLKKRLTK